MDYFHLSIILLLSVSSLVLFLRRRNPGPYPPGPKGLPLLGASLIHPKTEFWKTYAEWDQQYGGNGIISFHVSGRRMVVLNSFKTADELLNKRSAIYSDRPFPMMSGLLMKREKSIFLLPYNERFKTYRRHLHKAFNPWASLKYADIQELEAHRLIESTLKSPEKLFDHFRRDAASVVLRMTFGYNMASENDPIFALSEESVTLGSVASAPGRWLVDSFPILRYLPDWMPGAGFKRKAKEWGERMHTQSLIPHEYVKQQMATGNALPSFTASLLQRDDGKPATDEDEDVALWAAGGLYAAGADTTVVTMENFVLLMLLHPEFQKTAQKEIDAFISQERRLPRITDKASFPFCDALLKEVFRWMPGVPMGFPHCTARDDIYEGYFIPGKTPVIANLWAILHDPAVYTDPLAFNPYRFLPGEGRQIEPDPTVTFGFGRRVCPGKTIGENSVFIQSVLLLAAFSLNRALDKSGKEIVPPMRFGTGIVSHPEPFPYEIKERAPEVVAMVREVLNASTT